MNFLLLNVSTSQLALLLFVVIPLIFLIYTLYRIIINKQLTADKRNIWVVITVIFPLLGCLLYWLLGNESSIKNYK